MFRLAWTWLNRYHEPTLVGAAVTLFGLAFGLPAIDEPIHAAGSEAAGLRAAGVLSTFGQTPTHASRTGETRLEMNETARDDDYYRQKWASDAAAFYAANPPRDFEAVVKTNPVVTASLRHAGGSASDPTGVARASHSDSQSSPSDPASAMDKASAGVMTASHGIASSPRRARNWRVATFLAAGLMASLVFAAVWPARAPQEPTLPKFALQRPDRESSPPSDAVAITLPSAWVSVRPTARETVRRGILGASYSMAAVATWGIWF